MVFYGALSKGCQRCRQRRIKCDQRKPHCSRCERSRIECPGYRDLTQLLFRDESDRIKSIAKRCNPHGDAKSSHSIHAVESSALVRFKGLPSTPCESHLNSSPVAISYPPDQAIDTQAINYCVANFLLDEIPNAHEYSNWLAGLYISGKSSNAIYSAIEAVGMAALANIRQSSEMTMKSGRLYRTALATLRQDLQDPMVAVADATFLTVILLGLYETIRAETIDRRLSWEAHINGALALLELRGESQFSYERGVQLYQQIRFQILYSCLTAHTPVPSALIRATHQFQESIVRKHWQTDGLASPESVSVLSFQLIDLRAAIQQGHITDPHFIRKRANEVDDRLEQWRVTLPPSWHYTTIEVSETGDQASFDGKRHMYPSAWKAEAWNNWRALRILTNNLVVRAFPADAAAENLHKAKALANIQRFSMDICVAASGHEQSCSRLAALIGPLRIVAMQRANTHSVRAFAARQLQAIDAKIGIRQAGLWADTAFTRLANYEFIDGVRY